MIYAPRQLLKNGLAITLIAAILAPILFIPRPAEAQGGTASCSISTIMAALGLTIGKATQAGAIASAVATRKALLATTVPVNDIAAAVGPGAGFETVAPPANVAQNTGSFFGNLWQNVKTQCLDKIAYDIAKIIIRQMRNMVINWILTGNFGGPTFVVDFQADARQIASNAARLFLSHLTGINFCNYFPPSVSNLNFELNLNVNLQCNFQQSPAQYLSSLRDPGLLTLDQKILLLDPSSDPTMVRVAALQQQSLAVGQALEARKTQVTSGQGFLGVERCVQELVVAPEHQECTPSPGGTPICKTIPAVTVCAKKETVTPGSLVAGIALQPFVSEFREGDLADEFFKAIAAIVDTWVGKVINDGLVKVGL